MDGLFSKTDFPDLIVGLGEPDDAAVWRVDEERALIVTTDFFTPVVDDPYDYGAIAAANSLSDVYAMGGKPFLALNVAALPPDLPSEVSSEIMRGGAEKTREAGVVLAGGHTIQDQEPKYGLICLGFVHPEQIMTKAAARPGDILLLSKPLGFGTTTTAIKNQTAAPEDVEEVIGWMKHLNAKAAELAVSCDVRAATDITGFSLLGHAWEMAAASKVGLRLEWEKIPFTSGAKTYAEAFSFPGGAYDNKLFFQEHVSLRDELQDWEEMLLYDPQTSGGLLFGVSPDCLGELMHRAEEQDQPLWVIGEVVEGNRIEVV